MLRSILILTVFMLMLTAPAALQAADVPDGVRAVWDEEGALSDPDGLQAAGACREASCAPPTSTSRPDGGVTAVWDEEGAISDPNGLTARPEAQGPFGVLLDWLRAFFPAA